ncbi:uncharacterized protein LOC108162307 [Drosophila miranda]|uniref:uncharacterized protein LOC108162307 n=1 Tax=Drosophila miranda TaxID=7229 RepID=UPI0007E7A3E7|nr:uncharacterized protein LOC108162307 [Drosophila miranda]
MSNKKEAFHPTSFTNETMGTASPGREFLKKLLGKTVRVVLEDKLILIGILSCTDRDQNLILSDCATFLNEGEEPISRGDVMVPGEKISKISIPIALNMQKDIETKAENKKKEEQLPEEKGSDKMESQEQEHQEKAAEKTHLKED